MCLSSSIDRESGFEIHDQKKEADQTTHQGIVGETKINSDIKLSGRLHSKV